MTTVAPSHRIAQRAVLAVCAVLDQAGAITEAIKNDYGEDLFVQTHLKNAADSFNVLIQVKGRALKLKKNGGCSVQFDVAHIRRWVSHTQPVLVCIFDSISGKVFAFSPREWFSLWELATTAKKSLTVKLSDQDIFDVGSARRYIWRCRIEYYSRMYSWYENRLHYAETEKMGDSKAILAERNLIMFSFLKAIDLMRDDGSFNARFVQGVRSASANLAKENRKKKNRDAPLDLGHVLILSLLRHVEEIEKGVGLPSNLVDRGMELLYFLYQKFVPDEWAYAEGLLGGAARPKLSKPK